MTESNGLAVQNLLNRQFCGIPLIHHTTSRISDTFDFQLQVWILGLSKTEKITPKDKQDIFKIYWTYK